MTMGNKIWITAAAGLACAAAFMSAPAAAYTSVGVQIGIPGPVYVAPQPAQVYVPQSSYGVYAAQPTQVYVAPRGHYYEQTQWERRGDRWDHRRHGPGRADRDRDGVPNRFDRDRDGDGVLNRYDRAPNNPYRR
jgi:hypothetical protein